MARRLLLRAETFLEDHPDLVDEAKSCRGFQSGGQWMARAIARHRNTELRPGQVNYRRAGWIKYGSCLGGGLAAAFFASLLHLWLALPVFVFVFYAVEVRSVFLFPLLAEHGHRGPRAHPALLHRAGGMLTAMTVVIPLACHMLFGGWKGGGLRRPWLRGCVAVLLWYVDLRRDVRATYPLVDIADRAPLLVRRISVTGSSSRTQRVLYVSDLHLGFGGGKRLSHELIRVAARERPDLILLGGDLVDARAGLAPLSSLTSRLTRIATLAAIPGNHDCWVGVDKVRKAVEESGGHWLADESISLSGVSVDGRVQPASAPMDGLRLLCAHDPELIADASKAGYDLVLAGHLHGGQIRFFQSRGRDYPGAWFYRWNGPQFTVGESCLIVSRGCSDTLPFRWRCPRDVLLLTV